MSATFVNIFTILRNSNVIFAFAFHWYYNVITSNLRIRNLSIDRIRNQLLFFRLIRVAMIGSDKRILANREIVFLWCQHKCTSSRCVVDLLMRKPCHQYAMLTSVSFAVSYFQRQESFGLFIHYTNTTPGARLRWAVHRMLNCKSVTLVEKNPCNLVMNMQPLKAAIPFSPHNEIEK